MKRVARLTRIGSCLLAVAGTLMGGAPPQPQMEFTLGTDNSFNAEWPGVAQRTYFFQWSWDLVHWNIAPVMAHGIATEGVHTYATESSTPAFFARLRYADIPTTNPELADFDNDGLGNLAEVNLLTDPLEADSDKDGINDGVEVANFGDPLSDTDGDALRSIDSDGDGLNDAAELARGTSPTLWDSDGDGVGDANDAYPLDENQSTEPVTISGDNTPPVVVLEAPSNAVFVSGP
jgi:hypothetical protein